MAAAASSSTASRSSPSVTPGDATVAARDASAPATPDDLDEIIALIRELAEYEQAADEVDPRAGDARPATSSATDPPPT